MEQEVIRLESQIALLEREQRELIKKISASEDADTEVAQNKFKLLRVLTAYRMYGVTVLKQSDVDLKIRLDPSYNGVYDGQYDFVLKKTDDLWCITEHNLPYFMPFRTVLNMRDEDPKTIINLCQEYLKSYVCRKFQVEDSKKQFPDLEFTCTAVFNLISISFDRFSGLEGLKVTLKYGLNDELPREASFSLKDSERDRSRQEIEKYVTFFDSKPILNVLKMMMRKFVGNDQI